MFRHVPFIFEECLDDGRLMKKRKEKRLEKFKKIEENRLEKKNRVSFVKKLLIFFKMLRNEKCIKNDDFFFKCYVMKSV